MKIAVVQLTSTGEVADNLKQVGADIAEAARQGADWVVLPENFAAFGVKDYRGLAQTEGTQLAGPLVTQLKDWASAHNLWLCAGTLPLNTGDDARPATVSLVIDAQGRVVSRYHKIHLFDAQVADAQGQYQESASYAPGRTLCVVDSPWGRVGVAVCYDFRFPEMFQAYRRLGVSLMLVPAAFTKTTGEAHWDSLVRCRAIENGLFIATANQGGRHWNNRETWGHSAIVDPWGRVLGCLGTETGVLVADINLEDCPEVRQAIPTQWHREQRWARRLGW